MNPLFNCFIWGKKIVREEKANSPISVMQSIPSASMSGLASQPRKWTEPENTARKKNDISG